MFRRDYISTDRNELWPLRSTSEELSATRRPSLRNDDELSLIKRGDEFSPASSFISSPRLRLFGPGAAVHSDQDGGRLDILSPSGPHHGAGELEYGLRQRQESPR